MTETAIGYMPDVYVQWDNPPKYVSGSHHTETLHARGGGSQRIPQFPTGGYRRFTGVGVNLTVGARLALDTFYNSHRGMAIPFNFWVPFPRPLRDTFAGTLS